MLSIDRHLVDRAIPGNRITVTGIMSIMSNAGKAGPGGVAIRTPYLQVLGVQHGFTSTDATGASLSSFSAAEVRMNTAASTPGDTQLSPTCRRARGLPCQ
jgi:DNA replication licensing factor MCM5